jgi:fluoride ion exporter CrcB/FEX
MSSPFSIHLRNFLGCLTLGIMIECDHMVNHGKLKCLFIKGMVGIENLMLTFWGILD